MHHLNTAPVIWAVLAVISFFPLGFTHGETFDPVAAFSTFIEADDYPEKLERLIELEQQALALIEDEPLKLASIGAAILDIYPASQAGQYAMQRYYAHVDADAPRQTHERQLAAIQATMLASGDGEASTPFLVMTIYDAQIYARSIAHSPVGSIYQTTDLNSLIYLMVARPTEARLRQFFFDISHVLTGLKAKQSVGEPDADTGTLADGNDSDAPHPWAVIRALAGNMDTAAQAAIGAFLTRNQKYDSAISWLKVASRTGNILANTLLARIYASEANESEEGPEKEELRQLSLENYLHAIALGSTDSMYSLAGLYLGDFYGEENREAALPLLEQAGALGHADSYLYLAFLYNGGQGVAASRERAVDYFQKAAELENARAVIAYARFLVGDAAKGNPAIDSPILDQLKRLAEQDNPEAMVLLGNFFARGIAAKASNRKAVRWYRKAIAAAPQDPDIVNEVAWTLTVTDVPGLKRARYAHRVMKKMMTQVEQASERPEYLDTWAATYAARGKFERAIEIQSQAIDIARSRSRDDVMSILQDHLDQFKTQQSITEAAP